MQARQVMQEITRLLEVKAQLKEKPHQETHESDFSSSPKPARYHQHCQCQCHSLASPLNSVTASATYHDEFSYAGSKIIRLQRTRRMMQIVLIIHWQVQDQFPTSNLRLSSGPRPRAAGLCGHWKGLGANRGSRT